MPDACATITAALRWAYDRLSAAGCDTPILDAEVILAHTLQCDRAWLRAHPEHRLTETQIQSFATLVTRRCAHEPVAYLVGHKEFFGLDFSITPAVLVPRPETELLVEIALEHVADKSKALWVADVGTGSGALAIALAVHLPHARVVATDLSASALALARHNAQRYGVDWRVMFLQTDLLLPVPIPFDMVLANPPYLRRDELPTLADVAAPDKPRDQPGSPGCRKKQERGSGATLPLAWEPQIALDGGVDGLHVIRRLLAMMPSRLRPGGLFAMELGAAQAHAVLELAHASFPHAAITLRRDYAGLERVLIVVVHKS
ncbi:MAG: protein-(glutamine-N5) methyltransferase, release factor-specific [Ardenticatenia bacterium]|jgi:release factor glutamine methyltransferase|nr:MAG: protein-(glutamine-N5) methyltransferase, release factor-specific [Ardenticatenia bacterium]